MAGKGIVLSRDLVASELSELRRTQLQKLLTILTAVGWAYYAVAALNPWPLQADGVPVLSLVVTASAIAYKLRNRYFRAASWLFLVSIVLAVSLVTTKHPESMVAVFGLVAIVAASMLLGTNAAAVICLLTWITLAGAIWLGTGSLLGHIGLLAEALALFLLVFIVSWVSHAPLQTSMELALSAWDEVHEALLEARQRRATIYRTARALDEAAYRIERMNNELTIARDAAETAKNNKIRFAATVSHEIRGPLNLILGFSRLMLMSPERYGVPLPAPYRADMDAVYRSSQHLASLLDDILDLAQVDIAELPLMKSPLDVVEVSEEAVEAVRSLVDRRGLAMHAEYDPQLPPILGDRVRIRQVMINLLINAVRYTEHGSITISALQQDGSILVSVRDTGRGIAADEMPKIFAEFHRSRTPDIYAPKGTGLGLAISRYLVEQHGGRIWAESTLGVGTTIYFSLPLPEGEPDAVRPVHTSSRSPLIPTLAICLVAHPAPEVVRFFARHLSGYQVVGVLDDEQIPALVEQLHPRVIITVHEQVDRVRNKLARVSYDVPVIGCHLPSLQQPQSGGGAASHLVKPITPELVAATVHPYIGEGDCTILVVDDDRDSVRLLESMLTAMPHAFRLLKAYSGEQALALMGRIVPDLVLLDLAMPGMDGEETLAAMRRSPKLEKVPVIIVSARESAKDAFVPGLPVVIWGGDAPEGSVATRCLQSLLDALLPDCHK